MVLDQRCWPSRRSVAAQQSFFQETTGIVVLGILPGVPMTDKRIDPRCTLRVVVCKVVLIKGVRPGRKREPADQTVAERTCV
jgi:hypothetical protein